MNQIVREKIQHQFDAEAIVEVTGVDCNLNVTVISNRFEGLNTLSRHRLINALFKQDIANGRLHALSLKTKTIAEHQAS